MGKTEKKIVLPASWEIRPLGEVVQPTRPRIRPSEKPNLPFIGMENVEAHTMKLLSTVPAGTMKSSAVHFQPDDVLYGRLRPYLNKVFRPDFEGLCSAEFIVFPKTEGISSRYLQYFLNSSSFASYASHLNVGDRPRVDFEQLSPYPFPVAPYEQQNLVVAEIEKQFSRLDEAIANLKRVKANLKRYKASVLKAAVEGKLTEDWRKQHPDVEPASKLLERILVERRVKWNGRGKYKEPAEFLEGDCPDLPANWAWASLDSIANVFDPNPSHRMPKYVDNGVPFISSENFFGSDDIDFTIGKTVPEKVLKEQKARCSIREGDFVLTRIGTIGKTRFLPSPQTYCLSHALVIIQGLTSDIDRRYLRYVVSSDATIEQAKLGVQSVGVPDLGMAKIRAFRIPLASVEEQKEIVAEVERRLSVIEELEVAVAANLTRADRLRQSILSKAFSGGLTKHAVRLA